MEDHGQRPEQHTERLRFLLIDDDTRSALRDFRPLLVKHLDQVLDLFYAHIAQTPAVAKLFKGVPIDHARAMQKSHWLDNVFSGNFSDNYFAASVKIGHIHERIGLEPKWYIAGYCLILNRLFEIVTDTWRKKPGQAASIIAAINKVAFLDMDLAISAYIQAEKNAAAKIINGHANNLEREIGALTNIVASTATELNASAKSMADTATETAKMTNTVSCAAQQASGNVQTVAVAADQLSAAITEISRQVTQSTAVSTAAVEEIRRTNAIIEGLDTSVAKISDVVGLISTIARQTNMLALNATIEAARAGEAGKGFSVVAGEVKSLANHTAKATGEITAQIEAVQTATRDAVTAIHGIGDIINRIQEIASAIASSVEEQGAATEEIARNVTLAAESTGIVSGNIAQVTAVADQSGMAAQEVLTAADELSRQSEKLSARMDGFLVEVRRTH